MKTTHKMATFGLAAVTALSLSAFSASAYFGQENGGGGRGAPQLTEEQRQEIRKVAQSGDRAEIRTLLAKYRGEAPKHERKKHGKNVQRGMNPKMHEAIKSAVVANDYAAFLSAAEGTPMAEKITSEEDFALLVEMHSLHTRIQEIQAKLGFEKEHKGGRGGGGHMMQ